MRKKYREYVHTSGFMWNLNKCCLHSLPRTWIRSSLLALGKGLCLFSSQAIWETLGSLALHRDGTALSMDSERPTHGQLGLRLCIASSFLKSNPTEHHCFPCWLWPLPPQLSENVGLALGLYPSCPRCDMQIVPKRELVITGITLLSFFWILVLCNQLFRDNFQMAKFKN